MNSLTEDDPEWMVESTQDQKKGDEFIAYSCKYVLATPDWHTKFRKRK